MHATKEVDCIIRQRLDAKLLKTKLATPICGVMPMVAVHTAEYSGIVSWLAIRLKVPTIAKEVPLVIAHFTIAPLLIMLRAAMDMAVE